MRRLLAAAMVAVLAACAPDAMNNRAATGFNGFVNQISRACAPLQFGRHQFSNPLMGGGGDNSYDFWLDQTSRLYSGGIDPGTYRSSLNGFFGAGNDATIDCIVANLPK